MAENNPIKKDTQEEIENKINEEKTDSVKKGNKITKQDIIASLAEMKLIELNELEQLKKENKKLEQLQVVRERGVKTKARDRQQLEQAREKRQKEMSSFN